MQDIDRNNWEKRVSAILKSELKRKGVTYSELAAKLSAIGISDTEPNIRNKLARGKFTAIFLIQCFEAIGSNELRIK